MDNAKRVAVENQFNEWIKFIGEDGINAIKEKYRKTSPDAPLVSDQRRQRYIGEATILLSNIMDAEGIDFEDINLRNVMTYRWVVFNCQKFNLDAAYARDDNGIKELVEMYRK